MKIEDIKISEIDFNKNYVRFQSSKDEGAKDELAGLKMNIEHVGLLSPIAVVPNGKRYTVVSGNRRLAAFHMMKKETIPCQVMAGNEFEIAISDNIQRLDLTPVERGIWLRDYIKYMVKQAPYKNDEKPFDLLYTHLQARLGKSIRTIQDWINKADPKAGETITGRKKGQGRKKGSKPSTEITMKSYRKSFPNDIKKVAEKLNFFKSNWKDVAADKTFHKVLTQFKTLVNACIK